MANCALFQLVQPVKSYFPTRRIFILSFKEGFNTPVCVGTRGPPSSHRPSSWHYSWYTQRQDGGSKSPRINWDVRAWGSVCVMGALRGVSVAWVMPRDGPGGMYMPVVHSRCSGHRVGKRNVEHASGRSVAPLSWEFLVLSKLVCAAMSTPPPIFWGFPGLTNSATIL